jgi:hypothetical protein
MMSLSVTNLSSTATNATDRVAKVGDLRKHAEVLKQQLQQAKTPGTSPQDKSKANSLSQEIINIQSQIDRLILEGQLSKLTTSHGSVAPAEAAPSTSSEQAPGSPQASDDKDGATNHSDASKPSSTTEANAGPHVGPDAGQNTRPGAAGPSATGHFQAQDNRKSSPYQLDLEQGLLIDIQA